MIYNFPNGMGANTFNLLLLFFAVPLTGIFLDIFKYLEQPFGRILILCLFCIGLKVALPRKKGKAKSRYVRSALLSAAGALTTFVLATTFSLGTIVASGIVGLVGSQLVKEEEQAIIYLGVFVGTCSLLRFPSYHNFLLAGILGGITYEILDDACLGLGGRLGTMATIAVLVVFALLGGR